MKKDDLIQKYLQGELNDEENKELKRLIASDEDFANELEIQSVYYADRSSLLKKELLASKVPKNNNSFARIISIALLLICFIVAGIFLKRNFIDRPTNSYQQVAETYLLQKHDPPSVLMGNNNDEALWSESISLYSNESYKEAAKSFDRCVTNNIRKDQATLYSALSYMYKKPADYEKAIYLLSNQTSESSTYSEESNWYLALAFIKIKEVEKAKKILNKIVATKSWHYKKAEELLAKF